MKKNNHSSTIIVNIYGDNNNIDLNDGSSQKASKSKKSIKTCFKALGKLIHSIIVNISVLLIEIFAKLG